MLGKKNAVVDTLSRYLKLEGQTLPKEAKEDLETFINNALMYIIISKYLSKRLLLCLYYLKYLAPCYTITPSRILGIKYLDNSKAIA